MNDDYVSKPSIKKKVDDDVKDFIGAVAIVFLFSTGILLHFAMMDLDFSRFRIVVMWIGFLLLIASVLVQRALDRGDR